jgi:hypothetical protein
MLLPDRVTLMQRIQSAAVRGYTRWFIDRVDAAKWPKLEAKLTQRYSTDLDKSTRYRRRRAGEVVALLYGCPAPGSEGKSEVIFCLLATDGRGLLNDFEKDMKHFDKERAKIDKFELVHDGKTWSWRMTQALYLMWKERIHRAAALSPNKRKIGNDDLGPYDLHAEEIMDILYSTPGFRLARRQVGHLAHYMREEYKRLRPKTWPAPRERTFLKYVKRLPNERKAKIIKPGVEGVPAEVLAMLEAI